MENNSAQYRKLGAFCCPIVNRFLWLERKFVLYIIIAGHDRWYLSKSSNTTRWRDPRSSLEKSRRSNKNKKRKEWSEEFTENLENTEVLGYSLPERQKLRDLQENQDYEGSLQEAHCRCRTSSRKVRWLDNGRSQRSWWRWWIAKQSQIRNGGTRFSHSMDTILSVQNKNFSGNTKELAKVHGAVGAATSHLRRHFFGNWRILWRLFLESLHVNAPSIRDTWYCWQDGTQNKRRDICCTVTIRLGWKMAGLFCGLPLLSAKCWRPPGRWENTL